MKDGKIRWGILGPGNIAQKFAGDLLKAEGAELTAVGSRNIEKAEDFKRRYNARKAYGSYESLAKCPDVDVVYIATPHAFHKENSILCLQNGKHVLCEKPLAMNAVEVDEMVECARRNHLFLMEGIWTRFFPFMHEIKSLLSKGEIGEVKIIDADFGIYKEFDPESRLYNPDLGGGALLDVGIYPVFLALSILGVPDEINAKAFLGKSGVDELTSIRMSWKDGRIANLHCAITSLTQTSARISGSDKFIEIPGRWHESRRINICDKHGLVKKFDFPQDFLGYKYEIDEVGRCLSNGMLESPFLPLSFSRDLIKTLDEIRSQIGLKYPSDS